MFAVSCLALAPLWAGSAIGQTVETQTPDVAAKPIEEIVVTARKRVERALDVPIAITSFSREEMDRYALNDLQLIARSTPGLEIGPTTGASGSAISLRGIGGSPTSFTVEQPVAFNFDGVQVSQSAAARLGLFDVARIVVLKGPQTLFYGKNSPAGVISIVSADPTRDFEAQLSGGYEFYKRKRLIEGMVSGPLTDAILGRLAIYASKQDGWFRNAIQTTAGTARIPSNRRSLNNEEVSARATLVYESSDGKFDAELKLSGSEQDQVGGYDTLIQYIHCLAGRPSHTIGIPGASTDCSIDRNFIEARAPEAALALSPLYKDGNPYAWSDAYLASLTMRYDLSDSLTLESITGYYDNEEARFGSYTFSEASKLLFAPHNGYEQISQELRLRSRFDGRINFVVGAYWEDSTLNLFELPLSLGPPVVPQWTLVSNQTWKVEGEAAAVFGQITYEILDNLVLDVGARWSTETKSFAGVQQAVTSPTFGVLDFPDTKRSFDDISPQVTLTYKVGPDLNIYATYRTGFKSGGFNLGPNVVPNIDPSFDQETVKGAEVGIKGLLLDRQLRLTAAAYRYQYEDLQVGFSSPQQLATTIFNAAGARVQGAEAAAVFVPRQWDSVSLRASLNYNDSYYTSYIAPCYNGQTPAQGCNIGLSGGAFVSQDLAGLQLNRAPKWTGNLGFTFSHELNGRTGLDFSADATYSSSYMTDPTYPPAAMQEGYWRFDASVALRANDRWELAVIGRNLTNELVITNSNPAALTGSGTGTDAGVPGDQVASIGHPRAVVLELTFDY